MPSQKRSNRATDSLYLKKLKFDQALKKSFIAKIITNTRVIFLALMSLVIAGLYSFTTLPRELNPEVKIPIVIVSTTLPGANPLDVEELVTKKIETELGSLSELTNLVSSSSESFSVITAEFTSTVDPDEALQKAKEKVDEVTDLPEDASNPRVNKLDFNDQPVLQVALVSDSNRLSMSRLADNLQEKLETESDIRRVDISGNEEEELVVSLKPETLLTYKISAEDIALALETSDITLPAGSIKVNNTEYQLSVDESFTQIDKVRSLPISVGRETIPLGEIADVFYRSKESEQFVYFSNHQTERKTAVQLSIFKTENATITETAQRAEQLLEEELKTIPNVEPVTILNTAELITDQFGELGINFRDTVLLVFLTLFIFLGFRQASIASLSIPLTFLSTFTIMKITGFTLNFLSLFSLLLALGLVVDDAIVIVQASHRYSKKFKPLEMGILVFRDFVVPIWTTTLTTVWAFLPLLLSTGIIGEFIKSIPVVVSATLLSSTSIAVLLNLPLVVMLSDLRVPRRVKILFGLLVLVASVWIISVLASNSPLSGLAILTWLVLSFLVFRNRAAVKEVIKSKQERFIRRLPQFKNLLSRVKGLNLFNQGLIDFTPITSTYRRFLVSILGSTKKRIGVYAVVILFFLTSLSFLFTGLLKTEFFPKTDQEQIYINVEGPPGWSINETQRVIQEVEQVVLEEPELKHVISQTGNSFDAQGGGAVGELGGAGSHLGFITIVLPKEEDRQRSSIEIGEELRQKFSNYNQAKVTVQEVTGGPPVGADIQVNIKGDDLLVLEQVSQDFMDLLAEVEGAVNIDTSLKQNAGQIKVNINQQELLERGLRPIQLASWLRTAVTGVESGDISVDSEDLDITVELNESSQTLDNLQNLVIPTQFGQYSLGEVAKFTLETSPTVISREDQTRVVRVTAAAQGISATELFANFEERAQDLELPAGITWDVGGVNEENERSTLSIIQAMGVSVILILITMVIQLNSFRKSALVLVVIPLAVAGVFFNFTLVGIPLSFGALIGVLALFGIVVNNSIMLVEKINQNIKFGLSFMDAIVDACASRIEAIFFTSITTSMGLLPITLSDPFWRGLGGAIIAGLSVSGSLILFLLPTMYVEVFKSSEGASRSGHKKKI